MGLKYNRVLLKLSGEALAGDAKFGFDYEILATIAATIKKCVDMGAEVGIVVGGGNFWRGRASGEMDRCRADQMGMLATVMNSIAVCDALEHIGCSARVMTSISIPQVAEAFDKQRALRHFSKKRVVVFGGGTGNPYFSTDSAATLRALEIDADAVFKATMVDGIYDSDPHKNPNAKKYDTLTFSQVLADNLQVMDSTAASMCKDFNMPILVFNLNDPDNIVRAFAGENIGTLVKEGH